MLNGHSPENPYIPIQHADYATKTDVYVLENKVQGLVKEWGGMATAIEKLDDTLTDVKDKIESLVEKKGINDGIKACLYRCLIWFGGIIGTLITAHGVGLIKIFGKWINS